MERLTNIYFRFGFWIHAVGLGTALISWSFVDSYWGVALVAIGSLLAVSDPVVLLGIKRERQPERTYLIAYGLALLAVLLYVVRVALDVPLDKSGDGTPLIVRLRSLLLVLFFVSFSAGLLLRLGLMLGYSSRRSVTESLARIRQQSLARAVTSLVGALLFLVVVNYGTSLRNPSWDLTPGYFSFGSEARTLVRSLDRTVEVIAFLPAQQMVRNRKSGVTPPELFLVAEDVRGMLEQLPLINNRISLDFRNADLGLIDLTEFGSVNNGTIVLRVRKTGAAAADDKPYVERRVHVYNEKDLEKFEKEIVRALIQVSSPSKVMYFTASNGERYDFTDNARKLEGLSELQEAMRFYNLSIRRLDHQQNWPPKVPDDADALVIAGPAVPFSDDARAAVVEYLKKDGRVFISIDPAGKEHFGWLFAAMQGKQYTYSNEPLSFRYPDIVITDSIPEHRITESVALRADRIMVLPQTGRFEEARGDAKGAPGPFERVLNFKSTAIIHSAPGTVVDLNRNGKKDGAELTGRYTLGLAFEPAAPMAKPQQGKPVPAKSEGPGGAPGKSEPNKSALPEVGKTASAKTEPAGKSQAEPKADKSETGKSGGARLVVFAGTNWLTDRAMGYRVIGREHKNMVLALDSMLWLIENPLAAAIQPEERKARNIQVTDELKFRNIVLGMIVFPLLTGGLIALGAFIYRRRRKFVGEER